MTEPTYNPNAVNELNEIMGNENHAQQGWKKTAKNYKSDKDKTAGKESLKSIREELKKK